MTLLCRVIIHILPLFMLSITSIAALPKDLDNIIRNDPMRAISYLVSNNYSSEDKYNILKRIAQNSKVLTISDDITQRLSEPGPPPNNDINRIIVKVLLSAIEKDEITEGYAPTILENIVGIPDLSYESDKMLFMGIDLGDELLIDLTIAVLRYFEHFRENSEQVISQLFINLYEFKHYANERFIGVEKIALSALDSIVGNMINKNLVRTMANTLFAGMEHRIDKKNMSEEQLTEYLSLAFKTHAFEADMIFTHIPGVKIEEQVMMAKPEKDVEVVTISNNYGYIDDFSTVAKEVGAEIGEPLKLDDGTPIGYNIALPKNKPRAVIVYVYGGRQALERKQLVFMPNTKIRSSISQRLLGADIAFVSLNLPDLLELKVSQAHMPESLHSKIHEGIHSFITILKETPGYFHELANSLIGVNIFLYGASFGGRTAVRHAELYPDDVSGVISHDGALSYEMTNKTERNRIVVTDVIRVEPKENISRIMAPVFIMQNFDDNNVHAKVAIDFYNRMRHADKKVQLLFTDIGNPIPKDHLMTNKGHFITRYEGFFHDYLNAIKNFIINGPDRDEAVSDWRAFVYDIYANKYFRESTSEQRFISEALAIYIRSLPFRHLTSSAAQIVDDDEETARRAWRKYYRPLYLMSQYIEGVLRDKKKLSAAVERLKIHGERRDTIGRALESYLDRFLQFAREYHDIEIPSGYNTKPLQKMVMGSYQLWLENTLRNPYISVLTKALQLYSFYMANPNLIKAKEYETLYTAYELQEIMSQEKDFRARLITTLKKYQELAEGAWQSHRENRGRLTKRELEEIELALDK